MGKLGFQSGWTDPATGNVNMAATGAARQVCHKVRRVVRHVVRAARRVVRKAVHHVRDVYRATVRYTRRVYYHVSRSVRRYHRRAVHYVHTAYHAVKRAVKHVARAVKHAAKAVAHAAKRAARSAAHAVAKAAKSVGRFVKHHAAAITEIVVSTAVIAGCEAVTAGIGTIGCAAVAGAAGSLASQGVKCAQNGGDDCDASSSAESAVEGAVSGAAGGALGSLGGKILGKLAPKALDAVGGLFGKGAAEAEDGAVSDAVSAATDDGASGAGHEEPTSCPLPHSSTAGTRVLMADGTSKAIDQIRAGDEVANSMPGVKGLEKHKVERVIVTRTDHDFVKLTVKPLVKKAVRKAAMGLAASAAAVTTLLGAHHGATQASAQAMAPAAAESTLTTTYHHPFYDETQSAFVDADHLRAGDVLQTPTGTAEVTGVHLFHAHTVTYDLTINGLHTYYVLAGATPVLVHNCGESDVTTVYRKQDTSIPETQRLSVDADGNVSHAGSGSLYLNMTGDISHSLGFKGDQLVAFDVPTSYVRELSEASLPQRMPRGWPGTKREWNRALKMAPDQSDGPGLFGLRDHHIPGLLDAIIPGSGRIVG